eukprot:TRINITY_DN16933_c0_g1_i1.p1 TRINITY_DN16933_c0_g1~~TRINITY_DN16933_c0_g1_i1.p1  ORF type:complete len:244 (-),score=44.22 TRINITY_DN16933_c0_g1_i1:147-878(-)
MDAGVQNHLRSAIAVGAPAFVAGRHDDCWTIYRNTARSVISAAPSSPSATRLREALSSASLEGDASHRAALLQQAFDDVMASRGCTTTPRGASSLAATARDVSRDETPRKLSPAWRLSMPSHSGGSGSSCCGSRPTTPPLPQLARASTAPGPGLSMSSGWRTSHYTNLGAPRTNLHYEDTLNGGNVHFHSGPRYLTSAEAFHGKALMYEFDERKPSPHGRRNLRANLLKAPTPAGRGTRPSFN